MNDSLTIIRRTNINRHIKLCEVLDATQSCGTKFLGGSGHILYQEYEFCNQGVFTIVVG